MRRAQIIPTMPTKTLYLLEADDAVRSSATLLLSLFGWSVVGYSDPEACLQALGGQGPRPACLVAAVDAESSMLSMVQSGALRVPVVVTTKDQELTGDVRRAGAQCLVGPYDIKALLLAIGAAMEQPPTAALVA